MSNNDPGSQLRIIGGNWRGRKVSFDGNGDIRPSPDRVRETLFNWLQSEISGARCLELYAGSGILSLEALSRGAAHVTLVEKSPAACRHLAKTQRGLAIGDAEFRVSNLPALDFLATSSQYDIVFLDPPFDSDEIQLIEPLLPSLLHPSSCVYLESGGPSPASFAGMPRYRGKRAGRVHYALYRAA